MLRLTVSGAALACLCAAVAQGQQFSVTKLVHDVAQKAESAKQYEFEGDLLLGGQRGSNPGVVIARPRYTWRSVPRVSRCGAWMRPIKANICWFRTVRKAGPMCRSLGMTRAAGTYLSFTLGSIYVSPMSMAGAYATLAARGNYCKPIAIIAITDSNGDQLPVESAGCHRVMSTGVADAANFVLQGVITGGTAYNRGIGIPAAAKTGTANGGYYAAFAGYTPRLTGYVSVFNPLYPTRSGAMIYPRADYRELGGLLSAPGQMFGDNAPGAT